MAKYPYYSPTPNVYKPWIFVRLGYKKTHKVTSALIPALVDSGADVCFCSKDIGMWLGVQFKGKNPVIFTTANRTSLTTFKEVVSLYFENKQHEFPFYFSDELPRETPIILGQLGFFDKFIIKFDRQNKEMEIVLNTVQ